MFTMWPGSRSECCSTSRVIRTSPFTFVSKTLRSSSSVESVNGSRPSASPAALTRMSAGPACSTKRAQLSGSRTSSSRATSVSSRSTRRAPPMTRAPSAFSRRAVAAPIPLDAPVTIAVVPSIQLSGAVRKVVRALPGTELLAGGGDERDRALRVLAVAIVDVDGHQVTPPLGGLELHLEADRLIGRDDRAWLPDRRHRLPLVDLVRDADDRAREVVVGEERHVDLHRERLRA